MENGRKFELRTLVHVKVGLFFLLLHTHSKSTFFSCRATEETPAPDTSTPGPPRIPGVMSLACLVFLRRRLYLLPIITALWIIMAFFIS